MRILCLHGQGASARIFETQIAKLRAFLPQTWDYDYLEAPNNSEAAAELKGIYPGPNFCFFDRYTPKDMQDAVEYVDEVVKEDGPYDCVMGFSQGSSVAAAYVAQNLARGIEQPFKLAIFMCAALIPPEAATESELVRTIGSLGKIDIPTVHIIGQKDLCYNQSIELMRSCDDTMAQVVLHPGGHDVPRDEINCHNMAVGIERGVRFALGRH